MSVPSFYSDLNKSANDLFKKKFDLKKKVGIKHTTKDGLSIVASGTQTKTGIEGDLKANFKCPISCGKFEITHNTGNTLLGKAEFGKLFEGFTAIVEFGHEKADPKKKITKGMKSALTAKYAQEFIAATIDWKNWFPHDSKSQWIKQSTLNATGVIGMDGFSVGVAANLKDFSDLSNREIDASVQYQGKDFTVGFGSSKGQSEMQVSFFHKVSPTYTIGARATDKLVDNKHDPTVEAVAQRQLDRDTLLKTKLSSKGTFSAALQLDVNDPSVQVLLSTSCDINKPNDAPKFGLGLSLGEF